MSPSSVERRVSQMKIALQFVVSFLFGMIPFDRSRLVSRSCTWHTPHDPKNLRHLCVKLCKIISWPLLASNSTYAIIARTSGFRCCCFRFRVFCFYACILLTLPIPWVGIDCRLQCVCVIITSMLGASLLLSGRGTLQPKKHNNSRKSTQAVLFYTIFSTSHCSLAFC